MRAGQDNQANGAEGECSQSALTNELQMAIKRLRKGSAEYLELLWDYQLLFLSGIILFVPSILVPSLADWLAASLVRNSIMLYTHGGTPWGVVTSVFLYDSWMNIPVYFVILLMYVSFSDRVGQDERRRRALFASIAIFPIAILANTLWMLARPTTYSWGTSGAVYALWGILLAFTFQDWLPQHPKHLDPRTWYKDKKEASSALSNLVIFASTAIIIVLEPAQFLSAGPNINVFAHAVSFLGGYFLTNAYGWTEKNNSLRRDGVPSAGAI